jgi:putative membrane protein
MRPKRRLIAARLWFASRCAGVTICAVSQIASVLIALVAAEHVWFLVLEMFLWTTPTGLRTFRMTPEVAAASATLAANQGLYNGFLAAGLIWGLFAADLIGFQVRTFFLCCVVVAGFYGAYSVSSRILFLQAVPALLALILLWAPRFL